MSNTLTPLVPLIIAKGAQVLREAAIMPRLVNTDYSNEAKQKGETIQVPISAAKTVTAVTPGPVPPTPADSSLSQIDIPLTSWNKVDFHLTEKEAMKIVAQETFIPVELEEAFRALANQVNSDVFALYKKVYGYVGTAGTAPFGSALDVIVDVGTTLDSQLCGPDNRRLVLGTAAKGNAMKLAAFNQFQISGNDSVQVKGSLGERFGFQIDTTTTVPTHTSTPFTAGACTVNGVNAVAAGSTDGGRTGTISIAKATNTSPLVAGDVFTITGFTQTYTVLSAVTLAVGNTTVSIAPALKEATAGGEVVVLKASHTVNLAFHRNAFALAMRPVAETAMPAGTSTMVYTDPVSGIPFRVDMIPQYHQTAFEVSLLYGVACVRPEYACRLAG